MLSDTIVRLLVWLSGAGSFDGWELAVDDRIPSDVFQLADPTDPVAQSRLWEAVYPEIPRGALVATCFLESGCTRAAGPYYLDSTAIHRGDIRAGEPAYRGAWRRGHLTRSCEFYPDPNQVDDPTWFYGASTRGAHGMIASFNIQRLGPCVPFEALDLPFFSGWAAAEKARRICRRYTAVRKKPCTLQAMRCGWAQAGWGTAACGRVIRAMKKRLAKYREARPRFEWSYHPTLRDFRKGSYARRTHAD